MTGRYGGENDHRLFTATHSPTTQQKVTLEEGQQLAQKLGCKFLETSAKTNYNVETAFDSIVGDVRKHRQKFKSDGAIVRPRRKICILF